MDKHKYQFNYATFLRQMVPAKIALANRLLGAMLDVVIRNLIIMHQEFYSRFIPSMLKKLHYTGQVCSLEKQLNEFCMNASQFEQWQAGNYSRGVYIKDAGGNSATILNPDTYFSIGGQTKPAIVKTDPDTTLMLFNDSNTDGSDYDFIIQVPNEYIHKKEGIRGVANFFKLAGKRYDDIYYNN